MSKNILSYLSDYKQKPIGKDSPFNEVDGMIFAIFSYAPSGYEWPIRPHNTNLDPLGKTLGELAGELTNIKANHLLNTRFGNSPIGDFGQHLRFFKHIIKNPRYRGIKITGFEFRNIGYCQFCAFTFEIGIDEYIIAYRGTDGSLEGWYESYKMFNCDIPSQKFAKKYFQDQLAKARGIYRLVGHSKGGNLALSAAILCSTRQKLAILSIINFDGPGFTSGFIARHYKSILLIQHKTYRFSPADALISTLMFGRDILYYPANIKYVKPYGLQIPPSQHLYFNWSLNELNKFDLSSQSKLSMSFQEHMQALLFSHSPEEIDEVFEAVFAQSFNLYAQSGYILTPIEIIGLFINIRIRLAAAKEKSNASAIFHT